MKKSEAKAAMVQMFHAYCFDTGRNPDSPAIWADWVYGYLQGYACAIADTELRQSGESVSCQKPTARASKGYGNGNS